MYVSHPWNGSWIAPSSMNFNTPWNEIWFAHTLAWITHIALSDEWCVQTVWGDGTSRNLVSPYECSGTPGPQMNRPLWHNVPELIHPCHFASYNTFRLVQNDRDVSMQGHCVSGSLHLGDQGSENIRTGTHRLGTSRHPTVQTIHPVSEFRMRIWIRLDPYGLIFPGY